MKVHLPEELRKLQEPWLEGVPKELQCHIRFGSTLSNKGDGFHDIVEWLSGGAGTVMHKNTDEETYRQLKGLMDAEYFPKDTKPIPVGFRAGSYAKVAKMVKDDFLGEVVPIPESGWVVERVFTGEKGKVYVDLVKPDCSGRKKRDCLKASLKIGMKDAIWDTRNLKTQEMGLPPFCPKGVLPWIQIGASLLLFTASQRKYVKFFQENILGIDTSLNWG